MVWYHPPWNKVGGIMGYQWGHLGYHFSPIRGTLVILSLVYYREHMYHRTIDMGIPPNIPYISSDYSNYTQNDDSS